jgi:hypothetical protein
MEELVARERLVDLPHGFRSSLDQSQSFYGLFIVERIYYMRYLMENYPYLFSLAMRTNPFDANASAIVM